MLKEATESSRSGSLRQVGNEILSQWMDSSEQHTQCIHLRKSHPVH